MKTLGFGIKSLKRPEELMRYNYLTTRAASGSNPNQSAGVDLTKGANQTEAANQSIFNRSKNGDVGNAANVNNIFAQSQNKVNGVNAENNIFAQSKVGAAGNGQNNIFAMMNKIDENHKPLMGAQGMQPTEQVQQMNSMNPEELQKKLGKKLNILM